VPLTEVAGSTERDITCIRFDSRAVKAHTLFAAVRGTQTDGHRYISQAIENGAVAVLCEDFPKERDPEVTYLKVKNSAAALGIAAANFYDNPSAKLHLVGVTGTNGKTTTVSLLFRLFREMGIPAGMLSTTHYQINDTIIPATHTTPDAVRINELLAEMAKAGCKQVFMEVSSHAVAQHRTEGLRFRGGIFTNISHDHLDYHATFKEYIAAKKRFFDQLSKTAFALINTDDKNGKVMAQNTNARVKTYSLRTIADYRARILENSFSGLLLKIDHHELYSRLVGEFNGYNLLAVIGATDLLGVPAEKCLPHLSGLETAEGRFDYFISGKDKIVGIVDYAHTPDALKKTLDSVQQVKQPEQAVLTVVGCGGDRDKAKRPVMARIAAAASDRVILTSDNPRSEDPEAIIEDMAKGLDNAHKKKALHVTNRKEAIKTACMLAQPGDIILVAGKGHEKYQEINGQKHPFDDKKILHENFEMLNR